MPTRTAWKDRLIARIDDFQQRHTLLGFAYAVQKKYGDDEAGYQAALVTYYGFLSLFPLLVVALSLIQLSLFYNAHLKAKIIASLSRNFPIVGSQLENSVHTSQKAGLALIISLLLTLYGARGVAQAFQRVMNHIWQVPKFRRGGFVKNLKSVLIVILFGVAFIISGALSTYLTAPKAILGLRFVAIVLSWLLLSGLILVVFRLSLAQRRPFKDFLLGSVVAAVGLQIIQVIGGFLISRELKKLSSLYGTFAVILAILGWIYLLSRIMIYATEIDSVRILGLWPRSLGGSRLTPADKRAFELYAGRERYIPPPNEEISVRFRQKIGKKQ